MARYEVTITEKLQRKVFVDADSQSEAECIVAEQWRNSEHILYADDFVGAEFTATQAGQSIGEAVTEAMAEDVSAGMTMG